MLRKNYVIGINNLLLNSRSHKIHLRYWWIRELKTCDYCNERKKMRDISWSISAVLHLNARFQIHSIQWTWQPIQLVTLCYFFSFFLRLSLSISFGERAFYVSSLRAYEWQAHSGNWTKSTENVCTLQLTNLRHSISRSIWKSCAFFFVSTDFCARYKIEM